MYITSSKFYGNYAGVFTDYFTPVSSGYQISNCLFAYGNKPMLPFPSLYSMPTLIRPFTGISISDGALFQIPNPGISGGQPNVFDSLNVGVYIQETPVNVFANYFKHIHPYDSAAYSNMGGLGSGVFFKSGGTGILQVKTNSSNPGSGTTANFKNCDYGIQSEFGGVVAYNNRMDSVPRSVYISGVYADRILISNNYITHADTAVTLMNDTSVVEYVDSNSIFNVAAGIYSEGTVGCTLTANRNYISGASVGIAKIGHNSCKLNIDFNHLDTVVNGIYLCGILAGKINVGNNYITHTNYGVSLLNNSSSTQNIDTNTIYVNPPVNGDVVVTRIGHWGIYSFSYFVDSTFLTNTYGIMQSDIATSTAILAYNNIYGGRNCISLTSTRNTTVKDNNLYQTDHTVVGGAQAGMYAANCNGLYVIDNYCYGDSNYFEGTPNSATSTTATSSHRKSGFSFYNCSIGCQVCDNMLGGTTTSTGLGYGMLISSYCDHLLLANNQFRQSYYGITLQSSAIAHVLGDQGNLELSSENSFAGSGTGSFASPSGKRTAGYINISITSDSFVPTKFYFKTIYPTTTPEPGYWQLNGVTNLGEAMRGEPVTMVDGLVYDLCTPIWQNPITFPNYINYITRMDTVVAQNNTTSVIEPGFDGTDTWLPRKFLYESMYNDTALLDSDSVMHTFYISMDSSDIPRILQSELQNILLTDSATLADTIASGGKPSGYADAISRAKYLTNAIPDSNIRAANYKAMSNIYLNTLVKGIDTFTTGQLDTIAHLAMQCPYTAGDAVYMARSLYAQYDNTVFFDDLVLCTPVVIDSTRMLRVFNNVQDTSAKTSSVSDYILVYPNPAKNIMKVFYSSATNASMTFDLISMMGQKIMSVPVTNLSTVEIDVSNIADGLYLWKGRAGKVPIQTGKVSIQR